MKVKLTELSTLIQQELEGYESKLLLDEVGTVMELGDSIVRITGLEKCHGR